MRWQAPAHQHQTLAVLAVLTKGAQDLGAGKVPTEESECRILRSVAAVRPDDDGDSYIIHRVANADGACLSARKADNATSHC